MALTTHADSGAAGANVSGVKKSNTSSLKRLLQCLKGAGARVSSSPFDVLDAHLRHARRRREVGLLPSKQCAGSAYLSGLNHDGRI